MDRLKRRALGLALAIEVAMTLTAASARIAVARKDRLVRVLGAAQEPEPSATPGTLEPLGEHARHTLITARRVGRMVTRVARLLPWKPTCLRQSLATQWLLKRRRISSVMHLGIADVITMDAHAWVTVEGRTVNGRVARSFTGVASFHA